MRPSGVPKHALLVGAVLALAPLARAENWVDTGHAIEIDVDSIRQEADGLVYYYERNKYDTERAPTRAAVDCRNGVSYSSYALEYEADWRSKGTKVIPGTMGEVLFKFVCDRVT